MAKIGSSGNGKPSTQGQGTALGQNTVAGNVRDGYPASVSAPMKTGTKPSTQKGMRSTYLAPSSSSAVGGDVKTVVAGFGGSSISNPDTRKLPMSRAESASTSMKTGKKSSTTKGTHKGYL